MPLFRSQTVAMAVHLLYWVLVQTTAWLSVGDAPELSKAVEVIQRRVGCFLSQHLLRRVRRAQSRSVQLKITLFAFSLCFPIKMLYLCQMRARNSPPSFSVVRVRFGDADCSAFGRHSASAWSNLVLFSAQHSLCRSSSCGCHLRCVGVAASPAWIYVHTLHGVSV